MTPTRATQSVAARADRGHGGGGGDDRRQHQSASRVAGRAAILALAVAAVASLAPSVLLSEDAWAQTDESLGMYVENGTFVRTYNGSSTDNTYVEPRGLASDGSGRLIVADTGTAGASNSHGQRVVVLDDYTHSFTIGTWNMSGSGEGVFDNPEGVTVNSTGHIFVADRDNDRIQIFDSDGDFVGMFNESSSGKPPWIPRTEPGANDMPNFIKPLGVAISHDENLIYVTDDGTGANAIYYFNASTLQYVGKFGNRVPVGGDPVILGDTGDNRRELPGRFSGTAGIDVGTGGLLAIAEKSRYIVNVFDPAADRTVFFVGKLNANGEVIGIEEWLQLTEEEQDTVAWNGTGVPGVEEGQFGDTSVTSSPRDVAFNKDGSLLAVADPGNKRFQVFQLDTTSDGRATGLLHPEGKPAFVFDSPTVTYAVEFDSDDRLVVSEGSASLFPSVLTVYDVTLPAVKNVTVDVGGSRVLLPGQSIVVTVGFNTDLVRVDTTGGMPYMAIGPDRNATYVPYSGNTTGMLNFTYTVRDGDTPDAFVYNARTALTLNGSTFTAGARNVTVLTDLSNLVDGATHSLLQDQGFDVDRPKLVSVYSPNASAAAYRADSRIEIVLNYSERVRIVGSASPTLALDTGAAGDAKRFADYFDGNGTTMLQFNYTVQPGDNTASGGLRYAGTDALGPDSVSVVDVVGNKAAEALPDPRPLADETGRAVAVVVDAMPPSVRSVVAVSESGTYRNGTSIDIAVRFSEAVNVTGTGLPTLDLSTTPARNATYVPGTDGNANLTFRYAVQGNDTALAGLRYAGMDALRANGAMIVDAAGNMADLALPSPGTQLAGIIVNASTMMAMPNQTGTDGDGETPGTGNQTGTDGDGSTPGDGDGGMGGTGNQTGTDGTGDGGMGGGQNGTTTCSISLGRSVSDMDVRPGERSTEAPQTVTNSGTAPFTAVVLEAMPWYVDLPANTTLAAVREMDPAPDMLSASLTEVRLGNATGAMYAALPDNGTAAVAGTLAPGEDYPLSFVLDLTGESMAPGQTMTQFIEYTAECAAQ